jgi:hypothetical protein
MAHLLSDGARKWSTKKQEAYGIYMALKDAEYLLRGREFVLKTDHDNLRYLTEHTDQVEYRMLQFISEFDFKLEHVPGKENVIADPLSRMFAPSEMTNGKSGATTNGKEVQLADNTYGGINVEIVKPYFLCTHNETEGHHGINKEVQKVQRLMEQKEIEVPKNLRSEVAELIAACMTCRKRKLKQQDVKLLPHSLHGGRFFERLQMDFLEGLPVAADGCNALLVIVDTFSKFVMLFPVVDKSAAVAKQCLLYVMAIFGHPVCVVSDGGSAFKAEEFECLTDYMGTDTLLTHPYRPTSHGIVERVHQEIMKHLSVIIHTVAEAEEAEWTQYVPWVQRIINNTESRATGYAPVAIVFGQKHVAESKLMEFTASEGSQEIKDYDSFVTKHNAVLALVQDASNKFLDETLLEKFRKLEDEQEQCSELLKEGDYVLLRNPRKTKLSLKWLGPYRVVKATADNFYVLHDVTQDLESVQHREDLYVITDCTNDEEAREYARMDTNELTIEEVLSHEGDVQRPTTVLFTCKCIEMDEPIKFSFKSCKYVAKVQDYIKANEKLKPLCGAAYYTLLRKRKKTKKFVNNLKGFR